MCLSACFLSTHHGHVELERVVAGAEVHGLLQRPPAPVQHRSLLGDDGRGVPNVGLLLCDGQRVQVLRMRNAPQKLVVVALVELLQRRLLQLDGRDKFALDEVRVRKVDPHICLLYTSDAADE